MAIYAFAYIIVIPAEKTVAHPHFKAKISLTHVTTHFILQTTKRKFSFSKKSNPF
jgi:hypothetical protein